MVAFDVCWDLFEAALLSRPAPVRVVLSTLMALRAGRLLDRLVGRQMQTDSFMRWAVEHGTFVFGVERPPPGATNMPEITRRYLGQLQRHRRDRIIDHMR